MKLTDEMREAALTARHAAHALGESRTDAVFAAGYCMGQRDMRERAANAAPAEAPPIGKSDRPLKNDEGPDGAVPNVGSGHPTSADEGREARSFPSAAPAEAPRCECTGARIGYVAPRDGPIECGQCKACRDYYASQPPPASVAAAPAEAPREGNAQGRAGFEQLLRAMVERWDRSRWIDRAEDAEFMAALEQARDYLAAKDGAALIARQQLMPQLERLGGGDDE